MLKEKKENFICNKVMGLFEEVFFVTLFYFQHLGIAELAGN